MKTARLALPLLTSLLLCSCASSIPVTGTTRADATLKQDTMRRLIARAQFETDCHQVDAIETRIIAEHPVGWTADSPACKTYGCIEERWDVQLCGKRVPYSVKFTPDGEGGSYFTISPWH